MLSLYPVPSELETQGTNNCTEVAMSASNLPVRQAPLPSDHAARGDKHGHHLPNEPETAWQTTKVPVAELDTFHRFPVLPPELRLMIWEFALDTGESDTTALGFLDGRLINRWATTARLANVCREARHAVLAKAVIPAQPPPTSIVRSVSEQNDLIYPWDKWRVTKKDQCWNRLPTARQTSHWLSDFPSALLFVGPAPADGLDTTPIPSLLKASVIVVNESPHIGAFIYNVALYAQCLKALIVITGEMDAATSIDPRRRLSIFFPSMTADPVLHMDKLEDVCPETPIASQYQPVFHAFHVSPRPAAVPQSGT
jgi:hypothetical protein